jgi:heterodisulfide reductase subunit A
MSEMTDTLTGVSEIQAMPRVGVFICDCGDKIARILNTETLRQQAADLPEVVYAVHDAYPCSKDGQARICKAIAEQKLDRVLIAGCAPRLVEKLFRGVAQAAGLDANFLAIANIREHCAYAHPQDVAQLMPKAASLIEMGVSHLAVTTAAPPHTGRVVKSALVIGSGLSALTLAQTLADAQMRVLLVERSNRLGETAPDLQARVHQLVVEKSEAVVRHPMIDTLFNAHIVEITGHPGDYVVKIQQGDQAITYAVGVIVISNAARPKALGASRWFDRVRVKTQAEFEAELETASAPGKWLEPQNIVMIYCAEETQLDHCSRTCCNIGIRQAIRAKQINPNANITVLFRDLYLGGIGGAYEAELVEARKMGVTFFRYRRDRPPVIGDQSVDILDTLTGEPVRVPFDRVVLTMPLIPQDDAHVLASLLNLPQDEAGFLAEPRVRLRPGRYADPGIYVLGSSQQPADTAEALFQAYLTSSRTLRFLSQDSLSVETPVAAIDAVLCTGCGNCPQVCPTAAIRLEKRDGVLSLSEVDELRCIGCGNCVVVCPVKAISLPGWDNIEIPAQISAALRARTAENPAANIVALACEWSAYAAADVAGHRRLPYPANVRIIRMNCSARFDPYHILWAFLNGADGVFLGACPPGECHYGTGNLYAQERVEKLKMELQAHGVDPRRLRLEFLTVDDGKKFVETMSDFVEDVSSFTHHVPRAV